MPAFGFIAPSYQTHGLAADSQRWVNMYIEKTESGDDASPGNPFSSRLTPGKRLAGTLSDSPGACIVPSGGVGSPTNLFFAVSGATLFAIQGTLDANDNWTFSSTEIGVVGSAPLGTSGQVFPAQIIVLNPNLLFVVAAGNAWVAAYGSPLTQSDGTAVGSVATVAAGNGGAAYAVGDTGTIDGGLIPAQYIVDTVDANGAVLTYTIVAPPATALQPSPPAGGTGYSLTPMGGSGSTTTPALTQPGSGIGLQVVISGIGAAAWLLMQQVIPAGSGSPGNYVNSATFQDGYVFVTLAPNEAYPLDQQFFYSDPGDPTTWNPLKFNTKEANSDPTISIFSAYEVIMVFGSQTTELWQNTGQLLNTFQRVPGGGVIQTGLASPWAISKADGTINWLGSGIQGGPMAYQLRGVTPTRISNHPLEELWRNFDPSGATAYSFIENGHSFWAIHFPIQDRTFVYDSTLGPAAGWHERASADGSGNLHADLARYWAYQPANITAVLDYQSGNIYIQDNRYFDEAGTAIQRIRTSPHVATGLNWNYFDMYRLHAWAQVPTGLSPVCALALSNDGGNNFGSPQVVAFGATGVYDQMIEWRRQGRARNRVLQWTCNEAMDFVLVDMYADVAGGGGG